jgi:hypothetical protein
VIFGRAKTETLVEEPVEQRLKRERRDAVLAAEKKLSRATQDILEFQGKYFWTGEAGRLIVNIHCTLEPGVDWINLNYHKLLVARDEANAVFQAALVKYSEGA